MSKLLLHRIRRVVVHHSASPLTTTTDQIREAHLAKGWQDIGYHLICEANGFLRHGRRIPLRGAHALGANKDSIGICLIGDNTQDGQHWTEAQLHTLALLKQSIDMIWPGLIWQGHRDAGKTATLCPGLEIEDVLGGLT